MKLPAIIIAMILASAAVLYAAAAALAPEPAGPLPAIVIPSHMAVPAAVPTPVQASGVSASNEQTVSQDLPSRSGARETVIPEIRERNYGEPADQEGDDLEEPVEDEFEDDADGNGDDGREENEDGRDESIDSGNGQEDSHEDRDGDADSRS